MAILVALAIAVPSLASAQAATWRVNNNGLTEYFIAGSGNPTLTLQRGLGYVFEIRTPGHPFFIKTAPVTGLDARYDEGVTNNGAEVTNITFVVPSDAPDTLHYICRFHLAMNGVLRIVGTGDVEGGTPLTEVRLVPNPARGRVRLELDGVAGEARIDVHDVRGGRVESLRSAGAASVTWDGRARSGSALPAGLYFVRVTTASGALTRRLLWLGP